MARVNKQPKSSPPVNRPVQRFRHRNLEAAIWRNQTAKGPMYSVTVVRSYKEGEVWRESHSFDYDDLMNVAKLLYDAHSWISAERAREATERKSASPAQQ